MNPNQPLIESGWQFVMSVTGGGQEVLGELTRYGDMSNTLLSAHVPYSLPAYYELVKGKVDKAVSPEAARMAAMACFQKARNYSNSTDKLFGFASTASLGKIGGERQGRQHKVHMAIQDVERTVGIDILLNKERTRLEEEELVANLIRSALMWGCHRFADLQYLLYKEDKLSVNTQCYNGFYRWADVNDKNSLNYYYCNAMKKPKVVFSSSFNPLHDGHVAIIKDAFQRLGYPVTLELCVKNADKPALDYLTIHERCTQLKKDIQEKFKAGEINGIVLTNQSLFFSKAELFPGATFIVGTDTLDRIFDPIYYDSFERQLNTFEMDGCKFLVYPRKNYRFQLEANGDLVGLESFITVVGDTYIPSDLSSTGIRNAQS